VLQGIGVAAVGTMVACGGADPTTGDDDTTPDAGSGSDSGISMCGGNLCLDLTNPNLAGLAAVGGSTKVTAPSPFGKLIVSQPTSGQFKVSSAICTHAGCTVGFVKSNNTLACPCHGSKFNLDGTIINGPAATPLKTYEAAVDAQMLLTITLA
jgi:Rieske Fe-S protein